MASPILPNTSNFLGVALVVNRLRDGPLFVFQYPSRILQPRAPSSSDSAPRDELDDDDDELLNQMTHPPFEAPSGSLPKSVDLQNWNHDDHLETDSGSQIVPWEHVAGYPTKDLESLLTPSRAFHKKLFHVSLEQLCFASYPVYVPENGIWRKKKKQPKYQAPKSPENAEPASKYGEYSVFQSDIPQIETRDMAEDAITGNSLDEADEKKSGMTMFNLVFILNPKKHEARELAENLYLHIIKKINKAYKYSQQKSDFVWKESKRILAMKDKGRESKTKMSTLWKEILEVSSLAASMQDVYEAVSHNKIAALQLDTAEGAVTHSVQIPVPFYITDLPPDDESGSKGLWITTANSFVEEDSLHDPDFLDKNFALLLMSDEKKIIAELQADPDETTAAMIEFVRLSKPTMSFHQIGQGTALSPAQVRKYAQHFIFWRRAIAIPPLHARDVYILSPNSDMSRLPRASQAWAKCFPLAPPLPEFLASLSAAPRSYKLFAPSKNHRPTYLAMLAWLMRGGWAAQLCTFAYVVVWPEILYEVDYELEAEEIERARNEAKAEAEGTSNESDTHSQVSSSPPPSSPRSDSPGSPDSNNPNPNPDERPRTSLSSTSSSSEHPIPISLTSSTATLQPPSSSQSHTQKTAGEQAAEQARLSRLATRAHLAAASKAAAHARRPVPQRTAHPSVNRAPHLAHLSPYVIVDAGRVGERDSRYLSAIGRRLPERVTHASSGALAVTTRPNTRPSSSSNTAADAGKGKETTEGIKIGPSSKPSKGGSGPPLNPRTAWPVFWKYFDGRWALERVALHEDMKRRDAWNLLNSMSEYLLTVRHW
ncbi:nitrogen permease regulator of amino acid transport activity 3-domain-containing protein [Annulohypoxylon maeteangense]|uniref:nitrogen permease regulator of amino acid transport activity 3-domain-containing protein n=1 Tax=Annulohypoxylon maeteangense TaxID=1927788 RepID=UPI0020088E01|nr:nitrogen permease regulator of amino acid transport activity 3-domain-containing protein [Annulohypoxylon maeteangense]KAI0880358.1 nitrogen permease regulator of amino acid transport activity 3-domain-containing protein [Annulohypoxylon maeteangense]